MTHRLSAPNDFGAALKTAASVANGETDYSALMSLAQCDLTYLQAIQLDHVLRQIDPAALPDYVPLRLAVLSSSTVTHLLPAIAEMIDDGSPSTRSRTENASSSTANQCAIGARA